MMVFAAHWLEVSWVWFRRNVYACRQAMVGRIWVILLSSMLLAGCVTSAGLLPQAKKKELAQLDVGKTIAHVQQKIDWPSEDWWTQYHDPQLNALMQRALADNPNLHAAYARVQYAQSFALAVKSSTLPNLNAGAQITRERFTALQFIPPPSAGNVDWNNQVTASMSYDLDVWGSQKNAWAGAIDEAKASAADARQVQLALETAIVREYIQLSLMHALRDIAEQRMAIIKQRLAIARRGYVAGIDKEMSVVEIETTLPMAQSSLEAIDEKISLIHNQLAAFAGQGPGAGDALVRPALSLDAAIGLPADLPANLLGRRPDVVAHRWHVEAASHYIDSAKAAFYPNINLLAFVGFQALGFSQLISSAGQIAGIGPAISLPIYDGGRRRSQLAMQDAAYDFSVEQYNAALVHALQDVSDQLLVLNSNTKQQAEANNALAFASKSQALALKSYKAGIENYQHVLETQAALLNHQETIAQLKARHMDAYAGLMKSLGGGLINTTVKVTTVTPSATKHAP